MELRPDVTGSINVDRTICLASVSYCTAINSLANVYAKSSVFLFISRSIFYVCQSLSISVLIEPLFAIYPPIKSLRYRQDNIDARLGNGHLSPIIWSPVR